MPNSIVMVPAPDNDSIQSYAPGTPERTALDKKIKELKTQVIDIPLIIGGKEIRTDKIAQCVIPHDHKHILANYHLAGEQEVQMAIDAAMEAWKTWSTMPWESRVAIFKKMAALLQGPYRYTMNAAAMLNVSKNAFQAEIDAACELVDFYNFNAYYAQEIYEQ